MSEKFGTRTLTEEKQKKNGSENKMKLQMTMCAITVAATVLTAVAAEAPRVVPIDGPGLVLSGRTLADVQKNPVSAKTLGTAFIPGAWFGTRTTVVETKAGKPVKLHVELQHGDTGWIKCAVLELTEGAKGVEGWIIATRYLPADKVKFGVPFERPDGTFAGFPYQATDKAHANGYGVADLALAPPKGRAIATAEEEAAFREKAAATTK